MKSFWKFAVAFLCVAVIYGAMITWQRHKAHANDMKLAENARTCRARAEQGDVAAQADLAEMYYHGEGVQQDYSEALRWYRKAADHGNAKGQYGVGLIYYHGNGARMDLGEALRWYRKSADQGYAKAENGIGLIYSQGQGVQHDYAEAIRWYRKAIDQGYAVAEYNLGNVYYYGRGVPQDRAEAARWYRMAADQGDEYAQRVLGLRASFNRGNVISLSAMFLGVLVALKGALLPERNPLYRQQPALTAAGIIGPALDWLEPLQRFRRLSICVNGQRLLVFRGPGCRRRRCYAHLDFQTKDRQDRTRHIGCSSFLKRCCCDSTSRA